jgi:hypothetical protein
MTLIDDIHLEAKANLISALAIGGFQTSVNGMKNWVGVVYDHLLSGQRSAV